MIVSSSWVSHSLLLRICHCYLDSHARLNRRLDAFHFDRAVVQQGGDGTYCCQDRGQHHAGYADGEREFRNRLLFLPDDDAAHIAFMDQLLHAGEQVLSHDLHFLARRFRFYLSCHILSPSWVGDRILGCRDTSSCPPVIIRHLFHESISNPLRDSTVTSQSVW